MRQDAKRPKARPKTTEPTTPPEGEGWLNKKASAQALRAAQARQASGRRRFVDPTTCEREYSQSEIEFMQAMQDYKQRSGRMFPTWSEVLEVLRALGYEKHPEAMLVMTSEAPRDSAPSRAHGLG